MSLTRGLTEIDGAFASVSALQASKPVLDSVVSVTNGNQYKVSLTASGTSLLLANGYYAVQISSNYTNDDRNLAKTTTKSEFEALQNANINKYAGSGVVETGKSYTGGGYKSVNDGIWCSITGNTSEVNKFFIGTNSATSTTKSKTDYPVFNVDGVIHELNQTAPLGIALNSILLPPTSDGTETYDTSNGNYVQHASQAIAFASETATNKVIIERSDFIFIESWHEKISDKDVVYPRGNVQFGSSSHEGISLSNSLVVQSYSAFGGWDSETAGYAAQWSTLTDAQKTIFLQSPLNNIYADNGELIQVRFRVRVIKGFGAEWAKTQPSIGAGSAMFYGSSNFVGVRASLTTLSDYNSNVFVNKSDATYNAAQADNNLWTARDSLAPSIAYDGKCSAVPIALVSRLNQGAYHPVFNENGTAKIWNPTATGAGDWHTTGVKQLTSKADCFVFGDFAGATCRQVWGSIIANFSGRPSNDLYQYHDVIYAGLFEDLRISARRQSYSRLLEDSVRKDIAGTTRGKGKVPFTKVFSSVGAVTSDYTIVNQDDASAVIAEKQLPTIYDEIPMNAIGGNPSDIMTTFPEGIAASWLGLLDGTNKELIGKANATTANQVYTLNSGTSWTSSTASIDGVTNKATTTLTSGSVVLFNYPVLSNTTEPANNSSPLNIGKVVNWSTNQFNHGNRLAPSLIGEVLTGGFIQNVSVYTDLIRYRLSDDNTGKDILSPFDSLLTPVKHQDSELVSPLNSSAGAKALYTLTEKNGLLYMQYHGRELKFDSSVDSASEVRIEKTISDTDVIGSVVSGQAMYVSSGAFEGYWLCNITVTHTSTLSDSNWFEVNDTLYFAAKNNVWFTRWDGNGWGDDSTIPIGDGDYTVTDNNGQTVKAFCHHSLIPLGIAHYE